MRLMMMMMLHKVFTLDWFGLPCKPLLLFYKGLQPMAHSGTREQQNDPGQCALWTNTFCKKNK